MTPSRPPPYPNNFAGHDEHADSVNFAYALHPPPTGLYTLQHFCPSVTPHSSCLDVLLFRGVLLVAYAAADEVVIARGTDLHALKRLRGPPSPVTALAFRQHDAAVAAAFGTTVIVFEGWSSAAKERGTVYDSALIETSLNANQHGAEDAIISLSWDAPGKHLCAVADTVLVWRVDPDYLPVRYTLHISIPRDDIPTLPLSLGAISPDASFLAISGLYARIAYVWALPKRSETPRAIAEIVHGRSGIAALDWKRRGGGNQALMTSDRDGTIRLWVRVSPARAEHSPERPGLSAGIESWMEEIARSPHVERTPRAGATFLAWGGGGGVADDEGDAKATNAALPLLAQGTAPKPSRCYHWIVHVAGGDARAWRVRGLDDRPRAEFTRLEPGSGEPLLGVEENHEDELPQELPLSDVSVSAMKAVAPIPLTTASKQKVGLVKSYAISNGERRLRSPEPPDPPNVIAIFVLAIRDGLPFLARYDICPTSTVPAVCRARIGLGHTSPVIDLTTSQQSSSSMLGSGGWLASRGRSGDVLLWRTNVSTGSWESMKPVAMLPGPHTAIAFAPPRTTSPNRWEVGVLTCDAPAGSLRIFQFVNFVSRHDNSSCQDIQFARQVAICHARTRLTGDPVIQLAVMPVPKRNLNITHSAISAVFGLKDSGRLAAWYIYRRQNDAVSIEPAIIRTIGRRIDLVTCIGVNELSSLDRQIIGLGGRDGVLTVYIAATSEGGTYIENDDFGMSEDEDESEGTLWLKELCHLKNSDSENDAISGIEIMQGASRILATHASGTSKVWVRSSSTTNSWDLEFTIAGDVKSSATASSSSNAILHGNGIAEVSRQGTASIGYDRDGNFSVSVLRNDGRFDRFRRVLGHPWECIHQGEEPQENLVNGKHCLVHIGKGVVVASNGRGLSVLGSGRSDPHPSGSSSDAGGYSPSKAIVAQLLAGGRAWQVSAALDELHTFVRKVMRRNASEASYSAGKGLIAPPPALKTLLSDRHEAPSSQNEVHDDKHERDFSMNAFQLGTGKNLFMALMQKAEVSTAETSDAFDDSDSSRDLAKLSNRLRSVSLAGLTRSEQLVLVAVARACSALRSTLGSLDGAGARFALLAQSHREVSKTEPVPLSIVASAVHSSSADALIDYFLPPVAPGQKPSQTRSKMWDVARALGVGWWVNTSSGCKKLAERIARADFTNNRDPDAAVLWYVALGRRRALSALYRAHQKARMGDFYLRDFTKHENKVAAGKNAYVLVSKHRLEMAVAFFILSGDIPGALSLVRSRIKDEQLALFLARILDAEEQVEMTLDVVIASEDRVDDHRRAIALWLRGKHNDALHAASIARRDESNNSGDAERALAGSLPDVVHALAHVVALSDRPPVRGTVDAKNIVRECRKKAVKALLGDGSPLAALVISFEVMRSGSDSGDGGTERTYSKRHIETTRGSALLAAVDTIKGRSVCNAGAVRSGAVEETLQQLILQDITDLRNSPLGLERTISAVECATFEMVKDDEIDAAISATYAALEILDMEPDVERTLSRRMHAAQRNCLRVAVSKALFYVQGALSLLHYPTLSVQRLTELLGKYKASISQIDKANVPRSDLYHRLVLEFKGSVLSLRFALAFLRGDWPGILHVLRTCEIAWKPKDRSLDETSAEREQEDSHSMTSGCSSMAPDSVSIEALRHVASNPAILRISRSLGHVRRYRKTPAMSIVGNSNGAAAVSDESLGAPTLAVSADDQYAVIRMHPALSSTLATASAAYLAAHLASNAALFSKFVSKDSKRHHRNSQLFWQTESGQGYDQSFRLIKASECLEQLAEDAIAQWTPLQRFGVEATSKNLSPEESAGAFVDLWSTLGCLPEYAPSLSEAATVAAAEMAAAASRAAVVAAEQKEGGRRRRRRRERQGEFVSSAAKEGLKHFDNTSADSLYGAYPVRFSASAQGPWSGRGRHGTLYSEERALFRTLCISSNDPPAVVVATPKGIQEIVPSSYTTMPAGFRTHYSSRRRQKDSEDKDERPKALAKDPVDDHMEDDREDESSFLSSYDGFGEGPYVALDMSSSEHAGRGLTRADGRGKKAVWRHQVHATTLASHPLRRRFASGGADGVVRLWDFADPISLASFREEHYGRISDVSFSAYGNTMMAVYASGYVTIWDDPDIYSSHPRQRKAHGSRSKVIRAFDNRHASGATFLDERHTIAVVGDPTAPPSVGHSLRIFDTREPHSSFHASWSSAVNHQFEARCVALLEDRMRVVTGGLDGSLSITDIRTKACIAELPAHSDEVTCLALEAPRGRALVSGSANGEMRLWDSRTLLQLDVVPEAHTPTRHYWSGNGIGGLVGSYGTQGLALTDRSLISCGGDGVVKIWGPGWSDFDLNVL